MTIELGGGVVARARPLVADAGLERGGRGDERQPRLLQRLPSDVNGTSAKCAHRYGGKPTR
jgi:hypothetical protein